MNHITLHSPLYPPLLKEIHNPPKLLYYRGNLDRLSDPHCLGVVGSRKPSAYGKIMTKRLVESLATNGITIISGLAYGIDAIAHQSALDAVADRGLTIAVLACGLDSPSIYPYAHNRLAETIINAGGLLLSEYPPGTPALPHHFVLRNRIIAGLSKGVLITECGLKSGALITTKHALEQNRDIYALPGPVNSSMSTGPNHLIKQGAQLITEADDILLNFGISPQISHQTIISSANLTNQQDKVLQCLQIAKSPDDIRADTGLAIAEINTILTILEINGLIENFNGKYQTLS